MRQAINNCAQNEIVGLCQKSFINEQTMNIEWIRTSVGQITARTPLNVFFVKDLSPMLPTMHYKETETRNVKTSHRIYQRKVDEKQHTINNQNFLGENSKLSPPRKFQKLLQLIVCPSLMLLFWPFSELVTISPSENTSK